MATRRFLTAREQHEMLSPWRTAAPARHYDLEEALRSHGVVHTTGGRRLPCGHRHAVADQRTQESRLLDPRGWERHLTFTPSGLAVAGARAYTGLRGLQDPHQYDYTHVMQTPETVRTVGRLYDALPEHDPKAAPHFEAMRREINDQHDFITNRLGIRTEVVDHDPYSDVHEMMDDINHHKRMKVLGTHVTGGHPFFSDDENDKFRAVHDFFGHAATGRSFDRHGEQAAYLAHAQMFTPAARPALTSETKGQNASLILNGHFGPQKVAALPPEHWSGAAVDLSKLPRLRAPEPDQPGQDRRTAARRLAERADDLRWERDSSGNWILITRNPDGNPVAVRTERAPSVRTSRRTAMPAINPPAPASEGRPETLWELADPPQPTLSLGLPHEIAFGDYKVPVDRKPQKLYREIGLDLRHPDADAIRHHLYGTGLEIDQSQWPEDYDHPYWFVPERDYIPGMPKNKEMDVRQNLTDVDVAHHVLDYLSTEKPWKLHEDSLGTHWSVDSQPHSWADEDQFGFGKYLLPVRLTADWMGFDEDYSRKDTGGENEGEKEITLLPGAPVKITQVHIRHPQTGEWHPLLPDGYDHPALHRQAHRTAMPQPTPDGLSFTLHTRQDSLDKAMRRSQYFAFAPAVTAHLDGDPDPVGHLEWATVDSGYPAGEVQFIHVKPEHRRHNIATAMFDWVRANVEPRLHHSDRRSELGSQWANHEQSRHARRTHHTLRSFWD